MSATRAERALGAASIAAIALSLAPSAAAQTASAAARTLFHEARTLMDKGRHVEACPKLEESLRLDHGIGTQFNLAHCWEKLGRTASAWGLFMDAASASAAAGQRKRAKAAEQRAASLEPARTITAHKAYPINQGPFYALRLVGGITFTMGGIATDDVGRVLNERNAPIPGLYAAGNTTGGLEGGPTAAYIGGLAKSAAMALRASDHIAANRS